MIGTPGIGVYGDATMLVIRIVSAEPGSFWPLAAIYWFVLGRGDRRGALVLNHIFFSNGVLRSNLLPKIVDPARQLHPRRRVLHGSSYSRPGVLTCLCSAICGTCRPGGVYGWPLAWRFGSLLLSFFLIPGATPEPGNERAWAGFADPAE